MAEKSIRLTDPEVRAILAGTKTQKRLVVKGLEVRASMPEPEFASLLKCCPYGQPGDRLWVREAFALSVIDPDGLSPEDDPENYDVIYRADPELLGGGWADSDGKEIPPPWKPSIHMPSWASRILLEITAVRVERLQDISSAHVCHEGVDSWIEAGGEVHAPYPGFDGQYPDKDGKVRVSPARLAFCSMWESINGPGSWAANPWVWVIEFKRVEASHA